MRITAGLLICGLAAAGAAAQGDLKVMTYNVRYALAPDGDNAWPHRKEIAASVIAQYKPDVVGLQECLEMQATYFADALPDYAWFGVGRDEDGKGEMTAVFYRKDALDPLAQGHFWLSETPQKPGVKGWDAVCPRMASWAKFRAKDSGNEFLYLNTHLDHMGKVARVKGAELIAERLKELAPGLSAIVTGDFNYPAGEGGPWAALTQGGFQDAWLAADKRIGPTQTFGGFQPPKDENGARIDWILVRGFAGVPEAETVLFNREGQYPSDHYPVTARLRF